MEVTLDFRVGRDCVSTLRKPTYTEATIIEFLGVFDWKMQNIVQLDRTIMDHIRAKFGGSGVARRKLANLGCTTLDPVLRLAALSACIWLNQLNQ